MVHKSKISVWRFVFFAFLVLTFVLTACRPAATPTAKDETPEVNAEATQHSVATSEFNWKSQAGKSIKLLMVKHPFADTMIARLDKFTEDTGITVSVDTIPEEQFFDKLTTVFAGKSSEYDAYMVGSYMIWQYAPPGYMEPLDKYLNDPTLTPPDSVVLHF